MTENCIASVLKQTTDSKILVYKNDIGWLKACNEIMAETKGDIILLNDDTYLTSDIVAAFTAAISTNKEIGILGGVSLGVDGATVQNFGIYIATDGNTAHKFFGTRSDELPPMMNQRAVEGSCMYIRREVIDKIGYFDEGYGMGFREEVDYCFRAREAGFKVMSVSDAKYIHFVSQTHSKLGIGNTTYDYFMSKWATKLKLGEV